ncbi:hypothetical protein QE152_g19523 [Popillia japonica]|uniref:Uncharacterized protein n=1 Tax=Popillia japonica TaxID=7064 RepID=A0AAW1KRC3_POPJA
MLILYITLRLGASLRSSYLADKVLKLATKALGKRILRNIQIYRIRRYHETLPWFVGCAKKANVIQTKMVFKCDPNRNGVPALWRVEYNLDGSAQLPEEGDELKAMFKIIEKHHPPNTAIVNVHQKHHPPNTAIVNVHRSTNAIIDYGVYCECDPLNFEETVQRPGQLPGATLLENVANMKIAEEEKACQD